MLLLALALGCADDPPPKDSVGDTAADTGPPDSGETADTGPPDSGETADTGEPCEEIPSWADRDGDGWGDPAMGVSECEVPKGWVLRSGDCDDDDPGAHPEAAEVCNDRDDDCDGTVDEDAADAELLHPDADGDGFGAPSSALGCPGDGLTDGSDCDDADPAVNPDAEEVCGDGVDNDCDGGGCGYTGAVSAADADLAWDGPDAVGEVGTAVALLPDVDGDGLPDVVLGAPGPGPRYTGPGQVWVDPDLTDGALDALAVRITGTSGDDAFGTGLASAGDLDGDGRSDLWASAPERSRGASGVYLFLAPTADTDADAADVALVAPTGLYAGSDLSSGDLDGDAIPDLVVGSGWSGAAREGAVLVVPGAGVASGDLDAAAWAWEGEAADDLLHWSDAGDVDGDGVDDLLAGAYGAASTFGRAYLVLGPIGGAGAMADADLVLTGQDRGDNAGRSVAMLGDLDGDGVGELGVGAPSRPSGVYSGSFYVVSGAERGSVGLASAWMIADGEGSLDAFGWAAAAGDVDGDGRRDLLVSSYAHEAGGRVYGWLAPTGGTVAAAGADAIVTGLPGDYLGIGFAVGDLDGDGLDDLVAGASERDPGGSALVFFGGAP